MHLNLLFVETKIFDESILKSPTSLGARGDFPRPVNVCDAVGSHRVSGLGEEVSDPAISQAEPQAGSCFRLLPPPAKWVSEL